MGRKQVDINPECGKRLKEWLSDANLSQAQLGEKIHYSQQLISDIVRGKRPMSMAFAEKVREETYRPGYNIYGEEIAQDAVRVQWLLCLDDYNTDEDSADAWDNHLEQRWSGAWAVLDAALKTHGMQRMINHPQGEYPGYVFQIQAKDCVFYTIVKGKQIVKKLSVDEFFALIARLEKYAEFLLWELVPGGSDNG